MSDPILIDPKTLAEQAQHLAGQIRLSEMDERVSRHEFLAERQTPVSFALQAAATNGSACIWTCRFQHSCRWFANAACSRCPLL